MHTRKTQGRGAAGLTATQIIILKHAVAGPIQIMRADRKGTRCVGYEDDTGAACIVAYGNPEYFLTKRGLLRPRNQRHYYDITDAGRTAVTAAMVKLGG